MEAQCLYDVLGIERSATNDEIRSAYRKLALKWHPDKIQQSGASPQVCKEATERFQAIAHAFEVLGDPSERSWYDSHRSAILTDTSDNSEYEINLWPFFSPSAFSGYGDTGKGFYAVFGSVFSSIFMQEVAFAKNFMSEYLTDPPHFGGPNSDHEAVGAFYNYWQKFKTVKNYSWCDEYRLGAAENRKVRRLMTEENNKIRKREQREFNDTVRQLVSYVKKRDKRVLARQVEIQKIHKEKELAFKAKQAEIKKEMQSKINAYQEQEWAKAEDVFYEDDEDAEEEKVEKQEFFCVACDKRFKSEKQWENHEKSKKHIERAAELKQAILEEEQQFESAEEDEEVQVPVSKNHDQTRTRTDTRARTTRASRTQVEEPETDDDIEDEFEFAAMLNSRKKTPQDDDDESESEVFEDASEVFNPGGKKAKWKAKLEKERAAIFGRFASGEDELSEKLAGTELDKDKGEQGSSVDEHDYAEGEQDNDVGEQDNPVAEQDIPVEKPASGKKSRRKAKPAPVQKPSEVPHQTKKPAKGKKGKSSAPPSSTCEVCGQEFETRNMLFKHIDTNKHFVLRNK